MYDTRSEKMVEIMDKTEKAIGEVSLTQSRQNIYGGKLQGTSGPSSIFFTLNIFSAEY